MTYGDTIKIVTTITNYTPQNVSCLLVENSETYSISNLSIAGCSNCEVINQNEPPQFTP
jgi:hypothetical protein